MNASDNLFDSLTVGLIDENFNQPGSIHLYQNYPNPFNPITTISYTVGAHRHAPLYVDLNIYDILGHKVATLVNKKQSAGSSSVEWDASGFPSGVYYYKLSSGDDQEKKKMVLIK